jgi:hypothetical protein
VCSSDLLLTGDWANAFAISKAAVDENGKRLNQQQTGGVY